MNTDTLWDQPALNIFEFSGYFMVTSIRCLLHRPEMSRRLGQKAREFVRQHFLITRNIRDYLTLMILCDLQAAGPLNPKI